MFRIALAACLFLQLRYVAGVALPWLATEYIEKHVTTIVTATYYSFLSESQTEIVDTDLVTVIPTVTSIPTLSILTTVDGYSSDVTVVAILVPTGVGTTKDPYLDYATDYYINLVYSAESRCDPGWTYTTSAIVYPPAQVLLDPTSVSTSVTVPYAFGATSTEYIAYLNPTDIPFEVLSSISSLYEPYFSDSCTIPSYYLTRSGASATATSTSYSGSGSGSSSSNGYDGCTPFIWYFAGAEIGRGYICDDGTYYTSGMSITNFVLIWIFTWFGVFLILGLIESYANFANLAKGKKARRGMPCLFAGLMPLLSCFCLCFRKPGYVAKSEEEQRVMEAEWAKTPLGDRLKKWLKWGFRFKYPPFLGDAPSRRQNWGDKSTARRVSQPAPPLYSEATAQRTVVSPPATNPEVVEIGRGDVGPAESAPKYELESPNTAQQKTAFESVSRV